MTKSFHCKRCGKCCRATSHADICKEDIELWEKLGHAELFDDEMLLEWDYFGASGIYRNKTTYRCPFLKKDKEKNEYYCEIHHIKPEFCRQFPSSRKHAKEFCDCPGFE